MKDWKAKQDSFGRKSEHLAPFNFTAQILISFKNGAAETFENNKLFELRSRGPEPRILPTVLQPQKKAIDKTIKSLLKFITKAR